MERFGRLVKELRNQNIDVAVLISSCNIAYSTGFVMPYYKSYMETVAKDSPMSATIIIPSLNIRKLLVSSFYKLKAEKCIETEDVECYLNYDSFTDINPVQELLFTLRRVLKKEIGSSANFTIGLELQICPVYLFEMICKEFPNAKIRDINEVMYQARKIKTTEEIKKIRYMAEIMDVAQNTLLSIAHSDGKKEYTELDIWSEVHHSVNTFTGKLLPFVGELVTGASTGLSDYPLGPKARIIREGDSGIMDVSPRYGGFWGDTCNSVVFYADRDPEQEKYFTAVMDAFEASYEALKPGNRCSDVEAAARKAFAAHGFGPISYIGHEIGFEVNEKPRLTCYDDTFIEPGMVFCIEPQQYTGDKGHTGVRLEKMILIKEDGPEVLNHFQFG